MEKNYKSIIESLLFIIGDPISLEKIASTIDLPVKNTKVLLLEIIAEYDFRACGMQIIQIEDNFQMVSRRENYEYVEKLINTSKSKGMSQSALEILSIVAYRQPVTKSEIDNIRGVKSDKALSTLIERNLVTECGRSEKIGRPIIYKTTDEFLKTFGFSSTDDLPSLEGLSQIEVFLNEDAEEEK